MHGNGQFVVDGYIAISEAERHLTYSLNNSVSSGDVILTPVRKSSVSTVLNLLVAVVLSVSIALFPIKSLATAGDTISNTATISYDLGGVPTVTSATTSFTEDRRINFSVTDSNGGSAVPVISNMTDAVLQFVVTNDGNATQDFLLTARNTSPNPYGLPADNFDPVGLIRTFAESGATPGYQPAEDTAAFVDELAPSASRIVYVVANLPALVADDVAAVALVAQVAEGGAVGEGAAINADDNGRVSPAGTYSNGATIVAAGTPNPVADTSGMETVFNDPAAADAEDVDSAGVQDIAGNGQHADASAYQVSPPVIITKSVTVIDTLGGSDPHPGATLRYQLDVSVVGNTSVADLVINDPIPANTTYTDGSILLNGVAQTDSNDAPADYSRAIDILSKPVISIEVDLSQGGSVLVAPGTNNVIIFEVTID